MSCRNGSADARSLCAFSNEHGGFSNARHAHIKTHPSVGERCSASGATQGLEKRASQFRQMRNGGPAIRGAVALQRATQVTAK